MNNLKTRASLLARLKDLDDQRSWTDFYDTYWKLIHAVATKSGLTEAEADDAVQETMIAVAKKMPGFEYKPGKDSFKGWLLQLTRWKITDQFRKRPPARPPSGVCKTEAMERVPDPAGFVLEALWEEEWKKSEGGRGPREEGVIRGRKGSPINPDISHSGLIVVWSGS